MTSSKVGNQLTIGILALQGNFAMHQNALHALDVPSVLVKKPEQLSTIDGLIIPGGESTVMLKHFEIHPIWWPALQAFFAAKKPILGTCAGVILLAKEVVPMQKSLGFLNIKVARNAYGRQLESHTVEGLLTLNGKAEKVVLPFIRAPKILEAGAGVNIVAKVNDEIVIVEQDNVMGATCHPEATTPVLHRYFVEKCLTRKMP